MVASEAKKEEFTSFNDKMLGLAESNSKDMIEYKEQLMEVLHNRFSRLTALHEKILTENEK